MPNTAWQRCVFILFQWHFKRHTRGQNLFLKYKKIHEINSLCLCCKFDILELEKLYCWGKMITLFLILWNTIWRFHGTELQQASDPVNVQPAVVQQRPHLAQIKFTREPEEISYVGLSETVHFLCVLHAVVSALDPDNPMNEWRPQCRALNSPALLL